MSKISDIYDQIRTVVPGLFTGADAKIEIPNPYSLPDNNKNFLSNGWGLAVGDGSPSSVGFLKCDNESRNFIIVLTKELIRLDQCPDPMAVCTKALLEDYRTIKDRFVDFDQLGLDEKILKINFTNGSGIDFVTAGKFNFLTVSATYAIEYEETI